MTPKLLPYLVTLSSVLLVSCYPLPEERHAHPNRPADQSVTAPNQQAIQEQRDRMKERAENPTDVGNNTIRSNPDQTAASNTPAKPPEPKRTDYSFANPVPGKEGFVFSPYNNKVIDVRDMPTGTLVQDPTYPAAEKKFFRVP